MGTAPLPNRPDSTPPPTLITPGVIASELGQPMHRVLRVLATRPAIRPAALAGRVRLYDRRAIEQVRLELASIDRRRGGAGSEGGAA
ncbi:MAG: hypothetical protein AB7G11_03810 [Phycisphaerales bacterium]